MISQDLGYGFAEIFTGMRAMYMLKSQKNFAVIPVMIDKITSDSHESLLEWRGPAIQGYR